MRIEVNINKTYLFILIGMLVIFSSILFAFAYGSGGPPSVVGHSFEELENVQAKITNGATACSNQGLTIKTINPDTGTITCGSAGDMVFDWREVTCTTGPGNYGCRANCLSGFKVIGGNCFVDTAHTWKSFGIDFGNNGWLCEPPPVNGETITSRALCVKIIP